MRSHWTPATKVTRFTVPLLTGVLLLVGCDRAPTASSPGRIELDAAGSGEQVEPVPFDGDIVAPTPLDVDVTQLVPAPIELTTPALCGDLTVYDQEDVATLCSPMTLAATPIVSPTCPRTVSGSVRLETDLLCANSDGLIVGSDNTVIDLNGHKIVCTGEPGGYFGSCQGPVGDNREDDQGIDTNNHQNVHIFSHVPGGTVDGFDVGIRVRTNSHNVKVKQVTVTGPAGAPGVVRPVTVGIFITNVNCDGGSVRIGGGTNTGNDVSYQTRGIETTFSACVYIGANRVHDNRENGFFFGSVGIFVHSSPNSHIRGNVVTNNGDGFSLNGGLDLQGFPTNTTNTLVVENEFTEDRGNGVETLSGASDNYIVNNQMLGNTNFDAFSSPASVNRWNENNRCVTQTTPQPPPGVCSPDDAP